MNPKIIGELQNDSRQLLCTQTKVLLKEGDEVLETSIYRKPYGAYVELHDIRFFLQPRWIYQDHGKNAEEVVDIPCVLGAGYACSKKYWLYLKGLEGLIDYGSDESYISMKVWLEGGRCRLMKNIVIGHVYRTKHPYAVRPIAQFYNPMLLACLLLPNEYQKRYFSLLRFQFNKLFVEAVFKLYDNICDIMKLNEYYKKIGITDFYDFLELNDSMGAWVRTNMESEVFLKNIAIQLVLKNGCMSDVGLKKGKMGVVLFLFHYAMYTDNDIFSDFADLILDSLVDELSQVELLTNLSSGLVGIGWAIEYLYQNGFLQEDTNELLEEIDYKVMEISFTRMQDLNLDWGLGGIVRYLLARLYTVKRENKKNPFNDAYLFEVYSRLKIIIEGRIEESDSIDAFVEFILFYEDAASIRKPSIYDIAFLSLLKDYEFKNNALGLDGNAGMGLFLIFQSRESSGCPVDM